MEFVGQLVKKLGERSGESQNGHWRIAQFLLREVSIYPKNLVVDVRDDSYGKIEQFEEKVGRNVKIEFEINASVYTKDGQERWFNNVRAYRIKDVAEEAAKEAQAQSAANATPPSSSDPFEQMQQNNGGDLPY
jgi:predicted nucleic acid-binding protein